MQQKLNHVLCHKSCIVDCREKLIYLMHFRGETEVKVVNQCSKVNTLESLYHIVIASKDE